MRYTYQHLDWRELANRLAREGRMDELFRQMMLVMNGDVDEALDRFDELTKPFRQHLGFDRKDFEKRLTEEKIITGQPGERRLTARGTQQLRQHALERTFGKTRAGGIGDHPIPRPGKTGDWNGELRTWRSGDGSEDLSFTDSWLNHLRRGGELDHHDLMVRERDSNTAAATVLCLDVSHSMTLYGEDRITPAKQVAMAYAELLKRRFPRDSLDILLFGDDVQEVTVAELPFISNGPFHTNTCEVLRRAAEILGKKHQPTKRVAMITDGKPTAMFTGVGSGRRLMINTSYGLDPDIVTATLNQAARFPRVHIDLSVFMVASDPYLERFVARLVEVSRGKAFRADLGSLGSQVLTQMFGKRR